jgi:hypothetical protein
VSLQIKMQRLLFCLSAIAAYSPLEALAPQSRRHAVHLSPHQNFNSMLLCQSSQEDYIHESSEHEWTRRNVISKSFAFGALTAPVLFPDSARAKTVDVSGGGRLFEINDPETYSALVYLPKIEGQNIKKKYPVLFVLHGAGRNELDVWNLSNIKGEHSGLAPSLLQEGTAPPELYDNCIVITPYSRGKQSFYEEPRSKLLQFMGWSISSDGGGAQGVDVDRIDREKKFLFGFSDGATLGIELMTTGKFAAGVFAAYGFTGTLPQLALERLKGLPMWIFHSADDGMY